MSKEKGDIAEKKAVSFLKNLHYEIIETNFFAKKLGEVDIIASKDGIYHFIEVKSAVKHGEHYDPFENITPYKFHKLTRTIAWYLAEKRIASETSWVIDALAIHIVRETKHARINVLWNMTL